MIQKFFNSIKEAWLIISLAIVCGLIFNSFNRQGLPLMAQVKALKFDTLSTSTQSVESNLNGEDPEPQLITLEQTYALFTQKTARFIDAREAKLFDYGHIPGARSMPWQPEQPPAPPTDISVTQPLVLYCSDVDCEMAQELAFFLVGNGFQNIRIFHGGFEEWVNANYPIEVGGTK